MAERGTCRCCGQLLPLPWALQPTTRRDRLYAAVRKAGQHGIATDALIEQIYADDVNGGPLDARRTVYAMVQHVNKRIAEQGQRIVCRNWGNGSGYYILIEAGKTKIDYRKSRVRAS